MNNVFKIFLSMSASGSLLILFFLLGKRFLQDRLSRQWQYYIWLAVILRLLVPFGPETGLLSKTCQAANKTITRLAPVSERQTSVQTQKYGPVSNSERDVEASDLPAELFNYIWTVWLAAALGLFIRKVTIYQSFSRYVRAGLTPVSDIRLLDQLSAVSEQMSVKRPIELGVNPLISSPLLIGFLQPCIVMPGTDISDNSFQYTVRHELTHYKRRDMFYKWLVQITVCLHWFNPLVHLMGREINNACEFSCDEAVLAQTGCENAQAYGKTLLDAMAAAGKYKENIEIITLNANKRILKERLGAIVNFRKKSKAVRVLTGALTLCVAAGAAWIGVYSFTPGPAKKTAVLDAPNLSAQDRSESRDILDAERFYKAGSLPLFEIAFSRLDGAAQREWLEKIYESGDLNFLSAAIDTAKDAESFITPFAERAYSDEDIAIFSILMDGMSETELEQWLNRSLADGNWAFQSMLYGELDWDHKCADKLDGWEQKWEEAHIKEYQAVGVTMDDKDYYYQGQLVNIFLDTRPNKSFYTLNVNPDGTVNIKIVRDEDGQITGVSYLTDAELVDLFGDEEDCPEDIEVDEGKVWHPQVIPLNVETINGGEIAWLGEYTLSEGDRIWYDVFAETGDEMEVGFVKPGDELLNTTFYSVWNSRQLGQSLSCTVSFKVGPPVEPGTYQLYIRAAHNALKGVKGSISIAQAGVS